MQCTVVAPRWRGQVCVVAAPGPSLTPEVAERCHGVRVVAVGDAWRLLPWADILYANDADWWQHHGGCPGFAGERWSSHAPGYNDKAAAAARWGLTCVAGRISPGFSTDPAVIHYGENSGFQAVNVALLTGAARIVLVGFDMRGSHFFGPHPEPLRRTTPEDFARWIGHFAAAARRMRQDWPGVEIVNATPGSALDCFRAMDLDDAIAGLPAGLMEAMA
jgi:hypothetical protein